ncbi:ParB/RepB/Spo0J family partition protein [Candidatus Nanogingivalis gingivitcus]|jgi:parBc, parB-like nuclease domain|uniref:Chromosome-partitioning protein ParB n=1 Tax=Candidatus Nanogingivalis gingivitcus TaxID=2171992 RepID=A0ABY0FJS8_9BACT|nr:ParB/RepB/Spo0J family partition protein [Candidatus Nanogingivalis gingivitcus]RYC72676.1 putative chromosome-partitioning protein ParB [Candidatus Nanogingivalis gingivitcus]
MVKKGLGRGFSSLIPTDMLLDEQFDPTLGIDNQISKLKELNIEDIIADPEQPRRHFDDKALNDLANSIKIHGVLQPIVVVKNGNKYIIVAGERRYRASKLAKLDKIPAIIRDLSDQNRLELSLIENLQRADLNILETATAYLKLRQQFNMTAEQIGERVGGKSSSSVLNTLRLLKLPDEVKKYIYTGELKEGQARPLLQVDEKTVLEILPKIIKEKWSSRKVEQFLVQYKKSLESNEKPKKDKIIMPFEQTSKRLTAKLKADVNIKTSARGSGQIVIKFKNEEELKRIEDILS